MQTTIGILLLTLVVWSLAYHKVKPKVWTTVIAALLLMFSIFHILPATFLVCTWLVYIAAAVTFNAPQFRKKFITQLIFANARKKLPQMSQTERDALAAGDTWWETDLFRGEPDWEKFQALKLSQLSKEEQAFIDNEVETLCQMLNDWKICQEDKDLPPEIWDYLKKKGFFGLVIDKKYGGKHFSAFAHSSIVCKVATRSVAAAVTMMVPNSLGPAELLAMYGTEDQKDYYLPRLATGEEIPCFGLTAPAAGSDAASITDSGVITKGYYQGQEVLGITLTFDKRYITLAPIATVLGLAVKVYDPEHLFSSKVDLGITVCLIPTNLPGIEAGTRHLPMNIAFMNGPIRGKDVFIPLEFVIGKEQQIGKGWRMLMECLSIGRGISLPALAVASSKLSYRMTGAYARIRKQFKISIGFFEGVQEALARIAGYTYMMEACRIVSASAVDQGVKPSVVSAIAKYHLTEMGRQVVNDAYDIHAGRAIQMGPNNYLANSYFGSPISITVEGANILTRNLIIFGQGALRCHPYIHAEMEALNNADGAKGLEAFDELICKHAGYLISNFAKTFFMGITAGIFLSPKKYSKVNHYYRQITRMSAAFAFVSDVVMMSYGGALKRKERISARLGDVLSQLYLASTVLKYFHEQKDAPEDLAYVKWCLEYCLHKIQQAFDELFANFSNRWLGIFLSLTVFPLERSYKNPPKDSLSQKLVAPMLFPNALRDRITAFCYRGKEGDAIGLMELTLTKIEAAHSIIYKMQEAIKNGKLQKHADEEMLANYAFNAGIINERELRQLQELHELINEAIAVDEFTQEQLLGKKSWREHKKEPAVSV